MTPVQSSVHSAHIKISSVPQTTLLTLFARAKYSMMLYPAFYDAKPNEILHDLNYGFILADRDMAMRYQIYLTIINGNIFTKQMETIAYPDKRQYLCRR